jgi:hypothetical protein
MSRSNTHELQVDTSILQMEATSLQNFCTDSSSGTESLPLHLIYHKQVKITNSIAIDASKTIALNIICYLYMANPFFFPI